MTEGCNSQCGLFDFMANHIGIRVLHPGGHEATDSLLSCCGLSECSHVLDVACGVGTSALRMVDKLGCRVTGIDLSSNLIETAKRHSLGYENRVRFEVADALKLPFEDDSFDAVISQAFFVLIDDMETALKEMVRVLKPGGVLGALEKSWFLTPPKEVYDDLVQHTCSSFIPRVQTFEKWESFFGRHARMRSTTLKAHMPAGIGRLAKSEGLAHTAKIMWKMMRDTPTRQRMMAVQKAFAKHSEYLGYGIYCYEKPSAAV